MITAKCVSGGPQHGQQLEGSAILICSSNGDPLVLVVEQAPTMNLIYTAAGDGDEFIKMVKRYEPRCQTIVETLRVK